MTCLVENGTGVGRVGKLNFERFGVTALSDAVGGLDRLFYLGLDGNRLTRVPESIGRLVELCILSLYNNQLPSIPETIGQLTNLQQLYNSIIAHAPFGSLSFFLFFTGTSPTTSSSPSRGPSVSSRTSNSCIMLFGHRICTF